MITAEIAPVTTISANGGKHVGKFIMQATEKIGKECVYTVKEGCTIEDEMFDRGFISPYSVPDGKSQKVEFKELFILLSEKILLLQHILPSLAAAVQPQWLDIKLERAVTDMLRSIGSITITKEDTIVLNGKGPKDYPNSLRAD
jgi:chaperonin GroEL (HSP60 family)